MGKFNLQQHLKESVGLLFGFVSDVFFCCPLAAS